MSGGKHLCTILTETKNLQDTFYDFMSSYFRTMLPGKMGEDTIPFLLLTEGDSGSFFEGLGFIYSSRGHRVLGFKTVFFRIEDVNAQGCCLTVSFLLPLDIDGEIASCISEVYRLERTRCCLTLNIEKFCGIQFADPRLVNRKLPVVEPKW
ncbi:CotY/CotZ family spore coat protein [Bacillus sp. DJP31]|uniref:CotY/CotZ family spore coat protein n=1 Tax=Bacillus sp. DJP31 TaxID=3409789 RepID=UPI003BB49826